MKLPHLELWSIVNNAGILSFIPIEWSPTGSIDLFTKQMNVNCMGQIRVVKAFLPLLRRTEDSRVVNVSSLCGKSSHLISSK